MNVQDTIMKSILTSISMIKETVEKNILSLALTKEINLDQKQVQKLVHIINMSIDDGFQKSYSNLNKTLKNLESNKKSEGEEQQGSSKSKKK